MSYYASTLTVNILLSDKTEDIVEELYFDVLSGRIPILQSSDGRPCRDVFLGIKRDINVVERNSGKLVKALSAMFTAIDHKFLVQLDKDAEAGMYIKSAAIANNVIDARREAWDNAEAMLQASGRERSFGEDWECYPVVTEDNCYVVCHVYVRLIPVDLET